MDAQPHSVFQDLPQVPPDPILSLVDGFRKDTNPEKVNLSIGAYRSEEGKPYVFPVVKKAEQAIVRDITLAKEYLPIDGD